MIKINIILNSITFINDNFYLINLILIKADNLYDIDYC